MTRYLTSPPSQIAIDRERANCGIEIALQPRPLRSRSLSFRYYLLEPSLLLVRLGNVTGDQLACFCLLAKHLDVFTQTGLIGGNLSGLAIRAGKSQIDGCDLALDRDDLVERGTRRVVDVAARDEQLDLAGRQVRHIVVFHQRAVFGDHKLGRLSGLELNPETVERGRLAHWLWRVARQLPAAPNLVLDINGAGSVRLVGYRVGLLLGLMVVSLKEAVDHTNQKSGIAVPLRAGGDQCP